MQSDQFTTLIGVLEHHWIALLVTAVATALAGLAAILALGFAAWEIRVARTGTKASFLMELDKRYESPEMMRCRAKWQKIQDDIEDSLSRVDPSQQDATRRAEFANILNGIREQNTSEYIEMISILGFFETVGYIVDNRYMGASDIVDIWGESIRKVERFALDYIHQDIALSPQQTKLWEHTLSLISHTNDFYRRSASQGASFLNRSTQK